ncbi:phosphoribosyl-ATP diphosphatase [Clostridium fungisolvens]|uniref:Phosphoribosyl-ATP pyrophosphatase n=1 Tax=Clostridium fungisolvens TaxID=1604897 RepID=A0A6V8SFV7_9CLOT|nr:phosphoribosyl-ATP diphosphatase [Clostridium fungisolvens]GFP74028.1 Phosphoribosyl-ATP pyrophosphatase [Clostridium fungisolvens]
MEDELKQLYEVIKFRKENPMEGSYTNYLFSKGRDKILKKVGEECTEVIIEGKNDSKENGISEICDLLYHTLVLMADMGIEVDEVYQELNKRSQKIGNLKGERKDIEIL